MCRMPLTASACLSLLLAACAQTPRRHAEPTAQQKFVIELQRLAGYGSTSCGEVALRTDSTAAVTCTSNALASHQPFWLALQLQGIDSTIWTGVAMDKNGAMYLSNFDSDVYGRSRSKAKPSSRVSRCEALESRHEGAMPFTCKNSQPIEMS